MEIGNGGAAQDEYMRVTFGEVGDQERQRVRHALEEYCKLDTWGMVEIVKKLKEILSASF